MVAPPAPPTAPGFAAPSRTPGVYVQDVPGAARAITPLPTAVTAFVGHALSGPLHQPVPVHQWSDFERQFGRVRD